MLPVCIGVHQAVLRFDAVVGAEASIPSPSWEVALDEVDPKIGEKKSQDFRSGRC